MNESSVCKYVLNCLNHCLFDREKKKCLGMVEEVKVNGLVGPKMGPKKAVHWIDRDGLVSPYSHLMEPQTTHVKLFPIK